MNDDEKLGPKEFSEMFFAAMQNPAGLVRVKSGFPWQNAPYGEDHVGCEDFIRNIYGVLNLKEPRFSWAPSPAALFTAINMLRSMQGRRMDFIQAIVPVEDTMMAAKRTLLDAIIDRDVTVSLGAPIKTMLRWHEDAELLCVEDFAMRLGRQAFQTQSPGPGSLPGPRTSEVTLYPALHNACIGAMQQQAICFVPYIRVCWFSRPPVETQTYDDGHLKLMRFADGFTATVADREPRYQILPACAKEKHESCEHVVVTCDGFIRETFVCNCECHTPHVGVDTAVAGAEITTAYLVDSKTGEIVRELDRLSDGSFSDRGEKGGDDE